MSLLDSLLGGYVYAQQDGQPSAAPSRRTLIFSGATVTDDGPTANSTTVTISGGGGSFPGGDLCSGTGSTVTVGAGLTLLAGTLSASGGGGASVTESITQAVHGFVVGAPTPVYLATDGNYYAGDASDISKLAIGVAVATNASDFVLYLAGAVSWSSALSATTGNYYYTSPVTPGTLTSTEPTATSQYSNPILFATSATTGYVMPFRPNAVSGGIWPGTASELAAADGTAVMVGSGLTLAAGTLSASGGGGASVGPFASRPAASSGATYYPTDGWCGYVADGATWRPLIGGIAGSAPPAAATFTPINMSATSTLVDNNGVLIASDATQTLTVPDYRVWSQPLTGGSVGVEAAYMMAPTETGWDGTNSTFNFGGLMMRESATGKLAVFYMFQTQSNYNQIDFRCEYASAPTGGSRVVVSGEVNKLYSVIAPHLFLRMRTAGGTLYFEYSVGRGAWFGIASVAVATVFTTAPDEFGLSLWPYNGGASTTSARIIVPHMVQV